MQLLDPENPQCCFCGKPIKGDDIVAVVDTPGHQPAVAHLHHPGVRAMLIVHQCQITTGALLHSVAEAFTAGTSSDHAFAALAHRHDTLTWTQRARLEALRQEAKDDGAENGS